MPAVSRLFRQSVSGYSPWQMVRAMAYIVNILRGFAMPAAEGIDR